MDKQETKDIENIEYGIEDSTKVELPKFGIEVDTPAPTESTFLDKRDARESKYYIADGEGSQECLSDAQEAPLKPWGEGFKGGVQAINTKGRPKNIEKKNNKQLRMSAMLGLVRQLRPHIAKSIITASRILDSKDSADSSKLKAAALIIGIYKDTLKEAYDARYDTEDGEKIQNDITPMFSLTVLPEHVED